MKKKLFLILKKLVNYFSTSKLGKIPFLKTIHDFCYYNTKPTSVIVNGYKLFINPKDKVLSDVLIRDNIWESMETNYFLSKIKKGNIILDIGANIGYYTLLFSKLVGSKGKVFSFEPDPDNFRILSKNVFFNKLRNVVLVNKAVSDKTGKLNLFLDEMNKGDHRSYDSNDGRKSIEINSISLDDYFKAYKGKIDFIKIDTQGAEGMILRGMGKVLKSRKNIQIVCEFWPMGLSKSKFKPKEFLNLLMNSGFKIFELNESLQNTKQVTINKLLKTYTIKNKDYTNLVCIK